jgi:hypothetical protein
MQIADDPVDVKIVSVKDNWANNDAQQPDGSAVTRLLCDGR